MSVLLYVVGAIATMVGVGMAGYGIPINEFSFGNTLIVAGTTAAVGGLIVIAIGAAVGKLQRISEMLATRTPVRSGRSLDMFEAAGRRARRADADAHSVPAAAEARNRRARNSTDSRNATGFRNAGRSPSGSFGAAGLA